RNDPEILRVFDRSTSALATLLDVQLRGNEAAQMGQAAEHRGSGYPEAHHSADDQEEAGLDVGLDKSVSPFAEFFGIHPPQGAVLCSRLPLAGQLSHRSRRKNRSSAILPSRGVRGMDW